MFIHLHEPEQKPCDNCGQNGTVLFLSAVHANQVIELCKTCISEVISAFALVARKLGFGDSPSADKESRLLTLKELAELLSVHECTIYRQVKAGHIPFVRVGGEYRFNPSLVIAKLTAETTSSVVKRRRQERWHAGRPRKLRLVPVRSDAPLDPNTADSSCVGPPNRIAFTHQTSSDTVA